MKTEILKLLKEAGDYVSGQELCERLGVSRTAVWKVMNQLKEDGYQIDAVRNRGYLLTAVTDHLSKEELESSMTTEWAGRQVFYFEEVDSTNTKAKQLADHGVPHGSLIVADSQSMGKGRRGKSWVSEPASGIWMSLVLRPDMQPSQASMLTLVSALAVADGIDKVAGVKALIKWPNDLVVNGKKICGILTEMSTEIDCINYVVPGIGINVNMDTFPEEISQIASSLYLETGKKTSRGALICSVMKSFEQYYKIFMETKDLAGLVETYNSKLVNQGRRVKVLCGNGDYDGVALGINATGELLVQTDDGQICQVISGEVSVRGIYGYV